MLYFPKQTDLLVAPENPEVVEVFSSLVQGREPRGALERDLSVTWWQEL